MYVVVNMESINILKRFGLVTASVVVLSLVIPCLNIAFRADKHIQVTDLQLESNSLNLIFLFPRIILTLCITGFG